MLLKIILSTAVISILSCLSVLAQHATVKGNIKQIDSLTALSGVSVYLNKSSLGTSTNGNGNYTIENVPEGDYTIVVSAIGYFSDQKNIRVGKSETVKANFTMIEAVSVLEGVTVMTGGTAGIKDIPGSVQYISPKELQKNNYTDINRTLRAVPGINIQEEDGFGLFPSIGIRGTGVERNTKITVMEDGVLMAPAPYIAPAAYYFPTIGRMQAVEILKGSSQIKYGPYTTGGAINLISTQIPNEFYGRVNLMGGSFGGRNLHAYLGNSYKNVAFMVETFQFGSNGFKQLDGGGNTGFVKQDYLAKLRINTNEDANVYQSLTFKIGQAITNANETYLGLIQDDFNNTPYRRYSGSQVDQIKTKQSQFSLTHVAKFSKLFQIATTAYRTNFKRNWYKLNKVKDSTSTKTKIDDLLNNPTGFNDAFSILKGATSTNTDALFVKANNRSYYAQGIQTVLGFNFNTNNISHEIDFGIRLHKDEIDRYQWVDEYAMDNGVMRLTKVGIPGTESNRIGTARALASYVQYKLKVCELTVIPGLRYENITLTQQDYGKNDIERTGADLEVRSNTVDVIIPGIGLDYRFSNYLSTFAGLHKGFSPPGSKVGTKPEESINYELGVRYSKNALSGQAVLFFNNYTNLLGADFASSGGSGSGDLFNGGAALTKGLEFQLTYNLLSRHKQSIFTLPFSIVYTYTDARFLNDFESEFDPWGNVVAGDQLPYLANNQFTLMLALEHHKFNINLSGRYMDKMRSTAGQGNIPDNEKIDSYFIVDASANYMLNKNITLFTTITNLTGQVYNVARRPAGLRPGMPKAFNLGAKVIF